MPAVSRRGPDSVEPTSPEPLPDVCPAAPESSAGNSVGAFPASEIKQLLSTDVSRLDFFVTEKEAKTALAKLEQLPPSEFHAALRSLDEGGQLGTLLDKLEWADQCRFLSIAADKKSILVDPETAGVGPLQPPGHPKVYHQDVELPRVVNDLIGEYARAAVGQFERDYGAYSQRYEEAVGRCGSLRELQALGRPASAFVNTLATDVEDPRAGQYEGNMYGAGQASQSRAYLAVADRMDELTGVRRDGSAWFELKLEGQLAGLAGDLKLETGAPVAPRDQTGPASELKIKGKLGMSTLDLAGTGTTAKVKSDGTKELTQVGSMKTDGGEKLKFGLTIGLDQHEELNKVDVTTQLVKSKFDREAVGFEVTPLKVGDENASAELGSYASTTLSSHQLRAGLQGKVKAGPVFDAKLAVGGGAQLLSAATVARGLSNSHDVFTPAPELERGTAWAALSHERRAELERFGWKPGEWSAALEQRGAR